MEPTWQTETAVPAGRGFGKRVSKSGQAVYVSAALALTEPGPAAAGMVVTDSAGRVLAQRSHYLGRSTRQEASAQALLTAVRLALAGNMTAPVFRIDDPALSEALVGHSPPCYAGAPLVPLIQEQLAQLPGSEVQVIPASSNPARAVALTPLAEWLPERTQRAQPLQVRELGEGHYEVESESQPGLWYHVTLRGPETPGDDDPVSCECADFIYRNIPCKHLLAVARETGSVERLFHADHATLSG